MALSNNRAHRIITLCGLYVAQGVPWGFMLLALPTYLIANFDVGVTQIGALTGVILVPWTFKLIWAPVMDSFTIRSMGRRRAWIIGAELMMAFSLLGFIGLGNPAEKLYFIVWMYILHNVFASLQDVCTDALAVDVLPPNEQGATNGMMWCSKLVGKGIGAYGLSVILTEYGIEACVAVQIVMLLAIMLIPILVLERPGEKRFPWSAGQANMEDEPTTKRSGKDILLAVLKAFSLPTLAVYVVFTLGKLIGSGINEVVMKVLYTKHLDPAWTPNDFTFVSGVVAMGPIIVLALLGGFLADRFGRRRILVVGLTAYGAVAIIFGLCDHMWNETWFATGYVIVCDSLNAFFSVGFLSMAMRISWTVAAATVFTTYMTLSNVSHVAGNWLAGPVQKLFLVAENGADAEWIAYKCTFILAGLISFVPLICLIWVRPSEVDRASERDYEERHEGQMHEEPGEQPE